MGRAEIVNPLPLEHAEAWQRSLCITLLGNPYDDDLPRRLQRWTRKWDPEQTWGVRDGDRWVGTLATEARVLTVPGRGVATNDLPVSALTAVTVAATHRRQGLLSEMMARSLRAAKDRGDAASILIAAEWPIYGRFGYAPATNVATYRYHPRRAALTVPFDTSRVHQVEPHELWHLAERVFDAARRERAGQIDRHEPWWARRLGVDGYDPLSGSGLNWFVHDGPDGPDGVLGWKTIRDFELNGPMGAITVPELICTTPEAQRDLWGYLSGIDVIDEIELPARPVDEPARWLLRDGRALVQTEVLDFLWVRLLDVPAALSARDYAVDGRVVLEVVDDSPDGFASGRVTLEVVDGRARCTVSDEPADLRIDQRTLASIYLGGHRLARLAAVHQVEELTPGAISSVDLMFSTPHPPWNATGF